jgi:glycosyltransferase involved in cell wall biosynthesis
LSRGGLERKLLRRADLGIYDFDDALQWDTGGGLARRLAPKPRKCRAATAAADRVIAGNITLAEWASDWCADVRVIPTCVEPTQYGRRRGYELQDIPRIGWIGSPSTEAHLRLAAPALLRLNQETGARLTLISRGHSPLQDLEPITDRVLWTAERAVQQLAEFDIAIAPLSDTPYARGKCAYKILQYAAAGVPCVGSPIGANAEALSVLGYDAANTTEEWSWYLDRIVAASASGRAATGDHARAAVNHHYSFAAWESTMRNALSLSAQPP